MKPNPNDVIVTNEMLALFNRSIRIIDIIHHAGIKPVTALQISKLRQKLPEFFTEEILKTYDVTINYTGKNLATDLKLLGIDVHELPAQRIEGNYKFIGIPADDIRLLKKVSELRKGLEKEMTFSYTVKPEAFR